MFSIISSRTNQQLNATITELYDRSVSEKGRADRAEDRIGKALELLDGQDDEQAEALRAVLTGEQ
ncbi:hypothetical protein [Streptomyces syringium]|uniref:hypothetical protein n=1 Tax=Streptomyces syringium TaxID=76729 RepID=UPI0037CD548F